MRWQFNESGTIEDIAFNSILEKFYQHGIRGLVRENIQNSLDARLSNTDPVGVKISLGEHDINDIPNIDEVIQRIKVLKSGNSYTQETINDMNHILLGDKFRYITFEDYNTKGLSGSTLGYPSVTKCNYNAYAYTKGLHFEDEDKNLENRRGGSHGVGKIASNAASHLYVMYFANCDEYGNKSLGGTVQLIDHHYDGNNYRATGYFADIEEENSSNKKFRSIENIDFNPIFSKENRGLKIIIPFLRSDFYDKKEIIKSIVDSFLIAIISGNLTVEFEDNLINKDNIEDIINDNKYFDQDDIENETYFTKIYIKTLKNLYSDNFKIVNDGNEFIFKLFLTIDPTITAGRCGIFRTIGMKIEDRKIRGYSQKPYNALLIPVSSNCDVMLKTLENESHTQLEHKHIKNENIKTSARNFLRDLNAKLKEVIDYETKKMFPEEEKMETSDVLYEIDNSFKELLEKKYSEINMGSKEKPRTILKVNPTNEEGESPGKTGKRNTEGDLPYKRVKKTFGNQAAKSYALVPNTSIRRIVIDTDEKLKIIIPNYDSISNKERVNLLITLVDGMGQEMQNELQIKHMYSSIIDENDFRNLEFDSFSIKNIKVKNNQINLTCRLSSSSAKFYKMKYYLEV